jgi:hypothetical protein
MTYVLCNLLVPMILGEDKNQAGILRVQEALLVPSILSVLSGCILACNLRRTEKESSSFKRELSCQWMTTSRAIYDWRNWTTGSGMVIICWGAVAVGVLHAFQSVTNKLLVTIGLSIKEAGQKNAWYQFVALVVLSIAGLGGGLFEKSSRGSSKLVLLLTSLVAFSSSIVVTVEMGSELPYIVWDMALMVLSIVGVLAPVLALALIPDYATEPAKAYGVLDGLKNVCQFVVVLVIGKVREEGGFFGAMVAVSAGLGILVLLAVSWLCFGRCRRSIGGCQSPASLLSNDVVCADPCISALSA